MVLRPNITNEKCAIVPLTKRNHAIRKYAKRKLHYKQGQSRKGITRVNATSISKEKQRI